MKSDIEKPAIKKKTGVISDKGIKVTTKITKSAAKSARGKSAVQNKSAVKLMSAKAKLAKSAQRSKSAIQKPAKIQESVIQKVKLQP